MKFNSPGQKQGKRFLKQQWPQQQEEQCNPTRIQENGSSETKRVQTNPNFEKVN